MTKHDNEPANKKGKQPDKRAPELNWRAWMIRGVLLTVLIFAFVLWRLYPILGNTAFLWAFGLAAAIMGWTIFSYYLLNR
jgi:hypothetical protein